MFYLIAVGVAEMGVVKSTSQYWLVVYSRLMDANWVKRVDDIPTTFHSSFIYAVAKMN